MPQTRSLTRSTRAVKWARDNLFRTWWDTLITIVVGGGLLWLLVSITVWIFTGGDWEIIKANLTGFMTGRFPRDQLWRLSLALVIGSFAGGLLTGIVARGKTREQSRTEWARDLAVRIWPLILLAVLLLVLAGSPGPVLLVAGAGVLLAIGYWGGRRLPREFTWWGVTVVLVAPFVMTAVIAFFGGVKWDAWGGMLLTMFLAVSAILLSFPLGILLALGRRSSLPVARWMSVTYIEVVRGVPLISLLFLGFVMLALFFPAGVDPPSLVIRGVVVLTIFTAAYIAEIVRGGLQSVPRGQAEAAMALGLSTTKVTFFIVLPQALRAVIPALVGQFISLFKDTSLVAIVGLTDILAIAQISTQQQDFAGQGLIAETLLFAALIYWVGSFTMSRESQRLELRLGVGER